MEPSKTEIAPHPDAEAISVLLARLRARSPRVHSVTNSVAETFTANVLLAAGAIPSMTINRDEVPDFVASADALLVNLGTLYPRFTEAAELAVATAGERGVPWALDPVFVERAPPRLAFARKLIGQGPTLIRANRDELAALAGGEATDDEVVRFAAARSCVVACTGPVDLVTDGTRLVRISNGHPHMARVTAVGCAATALMAGFAAVEADTLLAAAACLAVVGVAGEIAAETARGPGSFVPGFLDALHLIGDAEIAERARLA